MARPTKSQNKRYKRHTITISPRLETIVNAEVAAAKSTFSRIITEALCARYEVTMESIDYNKPSRRQDHDKR